MPLQNDKLPSKHLQDGLALWFFFSPSNMQLKTRLFKAAWVLDTHHVVPSKKHRHTQRTTWSLANLFPHGFESWDGKMQRTLLWFYSLQSGFLMHLGFTTKWVSWNWSRKAVLDFSNCSGPLGASFLSTNWVLKNGWKQPSKTIVMKNKPNSTLF